MTVRPVFCIHPLHPPEKRTVYQSARPAVGRITDIQVNTHLYPPCPWFLSQLYQTSCELTNTKFRPAVDRIGCIGHTGRKQEEGDRDERTAGEGHGEENDDQRCGGGPGCVGEHGIPGHIRQGQDRGGGSWILSRRSVTTPTESRKALRSRAPTILRLLFLMSRASWRFRFSICVCAGSTRWPRPAAMICLWCPQMERIPVTWNG